MQGIQAPHQYVALASCEPLRVRGQESTAQESALRRVFRHSRSECGIEIRILARARHERQVGTNHAGRGIECGLRGGAVEHAAEKRGHVHVRGLHLRSRLEVEIVGRH